MTTLEKAIETYGKDMQLNVAIEEFSELIKEICKHKRGEDNRDNIIEEMADCYIMLTQLEIIFGINYFPDIDKVIKGKIDRLAERLAEKESKQ
jgi:NTP pyrophosphatase (non-canonical NTP hydrolase)